MKTKINQLIVFTAIFLVIVFICNTTGLAQKITRENGLMTISYSMKEGNVSMTIPEKLCSGTRISGQVVCSPDAEKGRKHDKQKKILNF